MVSVSRRSARGPSECCRSTADAARALFQGGSNDDARARVDIRRQKRPATLCISTVSIRARPHDEPLPVWIAPWRYASKRASAIDRGTHLHVNIRPSKRLATLCISTVSIRARPHDEPLPVWIAPWRYASKRASAIDRRTHVHVDIHPSKRLAALCISTVSIRVRSGDEPLPIWIAPWRYASKRASAIDRRTHVHVDIRPAQALEALWFSMVRVRVWSGGNAVPHVDNYPASQSKPCVFQR